MKEFALKHPILTFLLADTLISGLFGTIRAFAGKNKDVNVDVNADGGDMAVDIEDDEEANG